VSEFAASRVDYGRSGTKAARMRQVVHETLLEQADGLGPDDLRTNGRFVFYELEQRGDARKPSPDDPRPNRRRSHGWPPGAQDITDALTWLRENGHVPWTWITDETRTLTEWNYGETVRDYMLDALDHARINPWDVELPPLVLCESAATAAVLRPAVSAYLCPIVGIRGQAAGLLRTEIAQALSSGDRCVLYLGDLDRSGKDIEDNASCVLERAIARKLNWTRLAMTEQQAAAIEPIWKVDGRDGAGDWAWEVESLGRVGLIALLRAELDRLLPEPLHRVHERENEQRELIRRALEGLT
jgi:hypothetical protein